MLAFTLRRAIQAIGVMIAVGVIAFSMFRFAGDPVNQIVSLDTPAAEREAVRKSLGLDDPVPVQFARYFANAAQFKFGVSYQFRQPVSNLLMVRMPATLELAFCATVFAMVFGILMGVYSALRRDTILTKFFQAVSLIGISLPTFLIASFTYSSGASSKKRTESQSVPHIIERRKSSFSFWIFFKT